MLKTPNLANVQIQRRVQVRRQSIVILLLLISVAILTSLDVFPATIQSNGIGGGSWDAGTTWVGGVAPNVATDDIIIQVGDTVTTGASPFNIGTNLTVNGTFNITRNVSVGATDPALVTCSATGIINVLATSGGAFIIDSFGTLDNSGLINGSDSTSALSFSIRGLFRNSATGTLTAGVSPVAGTTVNNGLISISLSVLSRVDAQLINRGTIDARGPVGVSTGGTLENYGTINLLDNGQSSLVSLWTQDSGSLFVNAGIINAGPDSAPAIRRGTFINRGVINAERPWVIADQASGSGTFINEEGGEFLFTGDGGSAVMHAGGVFVNRGFVDDIASGGVSIQPGGLFSNESGVFDTEGYISILSGGTLANGFCGTILANGSFSNSGLISNCGFIGGTTGVGGITGSGTYDDNSCGGVAPDATVEVQVTESGSSDPLPDAQVFLERVCLPMGIRVPFYDVSGGSANFFLGAVEPAQYEIKAFAPGYAPFSSRVIVVESGEDRVEDIALTPDPNSVNTLRMDITVNSGGGLVTDNFQVTQDSGEPFQPTVTIDGADMNLVGLGFGATEANALVEGFTVSPANVTFEQSGPRTLEFNGSASLVGDVAQVTGSIVFAEPPPQPLTGFKVHFKRKTSGEAPPVEGQTITGADHFFIVDCPAVESGELCPVPAMGSDTGFLYALDVAKSDYYVVLSNERDTIISNTVDVAVSVDPTPIPPLTLDLPDDDSDGDDLPDWWETENELDPNSAAWPNGAADDKEPDLLRNIDEFMRKFRTHPNRANTDGDGYSDGFEHYAGSDPTNSDPDVPDTPPLLTQVYVLKNSAEPLQVGNYDYPVTTITAAKNRVANPGTIIFRNPGSTPIAFPGAITLGSGNKRMTLRPHNPTGAPVRLGATN